MNSVEDDLAMLRHYEVVIKSIALLEKFADKEWTALRNAVSVLAQDTPELTRLEERISDAFSSKRIYKHWGKYALEEDLAAVWEYVDLALSRRVLALAGRRRVDAAALKSLIVSMRQRRNSIQLAQFALRVVSDLRARLVGGVVVTKAKSRKTLTASTEITTSNAGAPPSCVLDPSAYVSTKDLAQRLSVPHEALRKRLSRLAHTRDDLRIENQERAKNQPKYLYRVAAVQEIADALKAKRRRD